MAKLLGLLLVLGALAGAVAFVPVGGRTVLQRWQAARDPGDFARRSWTEVAVATGLQEPPRKAGPKARTAAQRPVERHTESDRAALERVVSEHAQEH